MTYEQKLNEILEIIDTLKLYIQQDGGEFDFISYENDIVTVRLRGACVGCASIDITYESGLQELLRDEVDKNISVKIIY